MKPLRVAYFGSPTFSARFLEKITQDPELPLEIVLVVTQPDKPVGRTQELTSSAVKLSALQKDIPVLETVSAEDLQAHQIDLGLVFAYGRMLPDSLLNIPKLGFWNIHPSLLPLYRGPSPTAYALMMGNEVTGCSLMKMDAQMDHGPIIAQETYTVSERETHESLLEKLTYVGFYLLKDAIAAHCAGTLNMSELAVQNDSLATFTRLLKREDGFIELNLLKKALAKDKISSDELPAIIRNYLGQNSVTEFPILYAPFIVYNLFRGLQPWPGIWTLVTIAGEQKRLKIVDLELHDGALQINTVQLEGKNVVPFGQFQASYAII